MSSISVKQDSSAQEVVKPIAETIVSNEIEQINAFEQQPNSQTRVQSSMENLNSVSISNSFENFNNEKTIEFKTPEYNIDDDPEFILKRKERRNEWVAAFFFATAYVHFYYLKEVLLFPWLRTSFWYY